MNEIENKRHEENCGCGHEHNHEHHQEHGENCGCGHEHNHEHNHEHGENCGCGHEHNHEHQHNHEHNYEHNHSQEHLPRLDAFETDGVKLICIVENLGCANCAAKMESRINELPEVKAATLTFATIQLRVSITPKAAQKEDELISKFQEICSSIESEVTVTKQLNGQKGKKALQNARSYKRSIPSEVLEATSEDPEYNLSECTEMTRGTQQAVKDATTPIQENSFEK